MPTRLLAVLCYEMPRRWVRALSSRLSYSNLYFFCLQRGDSSSLGMKVASIIDSGELNLSPARDFPKVGALPPGLAEACESRSCDFG